MGSNWGSWVDQVLPSCWFIVSHKVVLCWVNFGYNVDLKDHKLAVMFCSKKFLPGTLMGVNYDWSNAELCMVTRMIYNHEGLGNSDVLYFGTKLCHRWHATWPVWPGQMWDRHAKC
ncbi:hypothetical protein R6Q59_028261 [Mikania micrantha]